MSERIDRLGFTSGNIRGVLEWQSSETMRKRASRQIAALRRWITDCICVGAVRYGAACMRPTVSDSLMHTLPTTLHYTACVQCQHETGTTHNHTQGGRPTQPPARCCPKLLGCTGFVWLTAFRVCSCWLSVELNRLAINDDEQFMAKSAGSTTE
jgi:hypothetical protein